MREEKYIRAKTFQQMKLGESDVVFSKCRCVCFPVCVCVSVCMGECVCG